MGGTRMVADARGNTVDQHDFSMIPRASIPRSVFNRSHRHMTAFGPQALIPIYCDEALPGDTFSLRTRAFIRAATMLFPIMDNVFVDFFFFAVPNRLLWENWEKFCGAQEDPADSIDYEIPTITQTIADKDLSEYMGLPVGITDLEFSAMWHRAYALIWNEWFRDENLQDSVTVSTADGPDTTTSNERLYRNKRHDYFTSCLPWTQKGDDVELPLGTSAPVISDGTGIPKWTIGASTGRYLEGTATTNTVWDTSTSAVAAEWEDPELAADLSSATAATINQIREAFQIQRLLERDARGGTRYTEVVRSHFGVMSPDARLQRPEYLGGGSCRVVVSAVPNTTGLDSGSSPVGELSGYGTAYTDSPGFVKSFTEHCTLLGLVNIRADITYQQGLERQFSRSTRYDFYWPALAHIGEQEVYNKEIYAQGTAADDEVFGYQERYAEYRYKLNRVSGNFRSEAANSLDAWHLALDFDALPTLDSDFIEDDPPTSRIFVAPLEAQFFGDFYFDLKCARPMPTYGVPGFIDRF